MDEMIPDILELKVKLKKDTLGQRVPQILALAESVGLSDFKTFKSPPNGAARSLAEFNLESLTEHQVRFETEDSTVLSISVHPNLSGTLVQANYLIEKNETKCRQAQRVLTGLLRGLFASGELEEGTVRRIGPPPEGLPLTPIGQGFVALVTTENVVNDAYCEPSVFWDAWDIHEQSNEYHLLVRGVEAATDAEWFRAVFENEWSMARAAKAGQTRFGFRSAPAGCESILMSGKSCLQEVGKRDGHIELAGFVSPGKHIPPWEILSLNEKLLNRRDEDGSPVSSVRVVFRNKSMAQAEGIPLLDIGAQVVFMGDDGLYHSLE